MTFGARYYDWQHVPAAYPELNRASPNLTVISRAMQHQFGLSFLGLYGKRPIRGSTTVASSHSFGAALDLGFEPVDLERINHEVIPWIVGWSNELHVSALHDYRGCRIWHALRTPDQADACDRWWRAQKPASTTGFGQAWANHLHLETTPEGWHDDTPLPERGIG